MAATAQTVEEYFDSLPPDRKEPMQKLRNVILENLPEGFTENISSGMLNYSVPLSLYPQGYHCTPGQPLPFLSLASQKNFIALYHMGIYSSPELLNWFTVEFPKHCKRKLDMGKSCIMFKKMEDIPYDLLAELASKMTPEQWISLYEKQLKR